MNGTTIQIYLFAALSGVILTSPIGHTKTHNKEPDGYEFKTILRNHQFSRDKEQEAIGQFSDFINKIPGISMEQITKKRERIISYIDTKDCDLLQNKYILRKRFNLHNKLPHSLAITLKFRGIDPSEASQKTYHANPYEAMTKTKYESDILINESSKIQKNYSYSGSIEMGKIKRISDLERLYPILKQVGIKKSKKLVNVNNFTALETNIELGTIKIEEQKCKASLNFWRDTSSKSQLLLSEFSFKCKNHSDNAERLQSTIAMNQKWSNQLATLKTSFAYGNFCKK